MASFAKACVDLSNNLRNFRFNKTPPALPSTNSPSCVSNESASSTNHHNNHQSSNHNSNNDFASHTSSPTMPTKPISVKVVESGGGTVMDRFQPPRAGSAGHSRSTSPPSTTNSSYMSDSARGSPTSSRGATVAAIKQRLFNQGLKIDLAPKKKKKTRYKDFMRNHFKDETMMTIDQLWLKDTFLRQFLRYFSPTDLCTLALICRKWNTILHEAKFWTQHQIVFNFKPWKTSEAVREECKQRCSSLISRDINSITLTYICDRHVNDFIGEISSAERQLTWIRLRCTSLNDRSVERLVEALTSLTNFELHCCNDISEVCLWSCLVPNITVLSISDCINISDESIGAISQLLPHIRQLNLQAYHVTDTAMTYFSAKQRITLDTLRLTQCMDITNQGVVNLAHALPCLKVLSLSGCSKLADDGVDVVCEKMKQLLSLDLSWCPKITDSGLECVACDLTQLEYLCLDRCTGITDTGLSYLSTMPSLVTLNMRWCPGITDAGIILIQGMANLRNLSLAGCKRISEDGLCALVRHGRFRQLEITGCRAATPQVKSFLKQNMSNCLILD